MKPFDPIAFLYPRLHPARSRLFDPLHWIISRKRFLSALEAVKGAEGAIDLAWTFGGVGVYRRVRPNQDRYELTELARRVAELQPAVIVEIGTRLGGTLLVWSQVPNLRLLVSIDLPRGIHGGGYDSRLSKMFHLFTQNRPQLQLELLRKDSQTTATRDLLMTLLNQRPIDFLFIDGDHRLPGVSRDYELYAPLVRPGGMIAFHDIRPNSTDPTIQVYQLWDQLKKAEPNTVEIIHEPYQGQFGIGVVYKG